LNPTLLVIVMVIVGAVAGKLLMRRFPTVSNSQIFAATVAWLGGMALFTRQSSAPFWHYTGLTIAVVMGTFLLMVFLRRLDNPRPTGSM
jgi:ABC-type Mn2+/Zn2+ transport system permease subunit